ncbi:probable ribose-5-phosphate isomerase 4, chloroplastic isoform X1 [Arachis hypogaea]|uniref:probable ribose-5-phosphate isomerase 4, chloroplastic isoform X1 n=1 Tax=Arachis hypogaea TaxID=3818 RepID=UPI003B2279D0
MNMNQMASLTCSSSSSFSTKLPLHSTTPLKRRRRSNHDFLRMVTRSCLDDSSALLRAAQYTVDTYVKSGMVVGLGSGHASGMAIQHLGRQLRTGNLKDIVGIPMSVASASEAAKSGIPLDTYQDSTQIDFAFDDADAIEEGTLVAIIGRRKLQSEESILQEKSILYAANKLVFIIEENQYKGGLEGSIPVLIQSVWRRPAIGQAGPLGGDFPLVTKEGCNVLDLIFTSPIASLAEVAKRLDTVDGVVDHGVVSKIPCTVVIASPNGMKILDKLTADIVG